MSVDPPETLDFQLQLMDIECAYEHDIATIPSRYENTMQVEEFASIRKDLALPGAQVSGHAVINFIAIIGEWACAGCNYGVLRFSLLKNDFLACCLHL